MGFGIESFFKRVFSNSESIKIATLQEDFFFKGQVFSYEDYISFAASETKIIVVDPTAFEPLGAGVLTRIPFNPLLGVATAGPILIDFYSGTEAADDGTILQGSNRDSTADKLLPDIVLRLSPTVSNKGTRFAGDMIPSTASGPGGLTNSGSGNAIGLPFAISNLSKYALELTNMNGDGVYVQLKLTWLEITG